MSKQLYIYAGIGLVFGAVIGGIAAGLFNGFIVDTRFLMFTGAGAALGLIAGACIDMFSSKNAKN